MKKFILFFTLILLNLTLRIWISTSTVHQGDIITQQEWATVLTTKGTSGSYFFPNWTYSPPTQPPLMMLAYFSSGWLYQNRNIFSAMHNLVKFPPTFLLLGFQKYGQTLSLQIWELLATYLIAFVLFFYFKKKTSFKKAFLCFSIIIFHPILIFINSIWGQNDILPTAFMYLSFMTIFSNLIFISPFLFLIGILFKPTILLLIPLFLFLYFKQIFISKKNHPISKTIIVLIFCLTFSYFTFKPFIPKGIRPLGYISSIFNHRIKTSSKGLTMASVSAFNFYSLFWNIDHTYATNQNSLIQLKDIGMILVLLINVFFIYKFYKSKKHNFNHALFSIYFIAEGSFLFMTNMLERYFVPALLASIILMIIYWKKFGFKFLFQNLIWLVNLIYAYYYRENSLINHIFRDYNFLLIRLLSFANLFIFFSIVKKYSNSFPIPSKKSLSK